MNKLDKDLVDIPGYEGLYKANINGQIWSDIRKKYLKQKINKYGYNCLTLYKNKKKNSVIVHRLIALTFISNPKDKPEVNHKDGNKLNNYINNLEWVTASENQKHAYKIGLSKPKFGKDNFMFGKGYLRAGEKCPTAKLTNKQAKEIRRLYKTGKYTQKQVGNLYGVSDSVVYWILKNKTYKERIDV